ncbi:MAG: hypothetical protein ACYSR7_02155 [Planctomycetota bacterium]
MLEVVHSRGSFIATGQQPDFLELLELALGLVEGDAECFGYFGCIALVVVLQVHEHPVC